MHCALNYGLNMQFLPENLLSSAHDNCILIQTANSFLPLNPVAFLGCNDYENVRKKEQYVGNRYNPRIDHLVSTKGAIFPCHAQTQHHNKTNVENQHCPIEMEEGGFLLACDAKEGVENAECRVLSEDHLDE